MELLKWNSVRIHCGNVFCRFCNSFQMRQECSKLVSVEILASSIGATSICLFLSLQSNFRLYSYSPFSYYLAASLTALWLWAVYNLMALQLARQSWKAREEKQVRVKTVDYNLVGSITSTTNVANELCYPCRRQDLSGEENQPRNVSSQEKRDKKKKRKKLQQVS